MTFKWSEYLDFSKEILSTNQLESSDESIARAAISRSYYACHWACRELLESMNEMAVHHHYEKVHRKVIDKIKSQSDEKYRQIGLDLDRIYSSRLEADYQDCVIITKNDASFQTARAEGVLNNVSDLRT